MVELLPKVVVEVRSDRSLEVVAEPGNIAARTSSSPPAEVEAPDHNRSDHNPVAGNHHIHSLVVEAVEPAAAMARRCHREEHSCRSCRCAAVAAAAAAMVGVSRLGRSLLGPVGHVAKVQHRHSGRLELVCPRDS